MHAAVLAEEVPQRLGKLFDRLGELDGGLAAERVPRGDLLLRIFPFRRQADAREVPVPLERLLQ